MPATYHYTIPRRVEVALVTRRQSYPPHIHARSHTIGLLCGGSAVLSQGRHKSRRLQAFETFSLPPRLPHALELPEDSCRLLTFSVDEDFAFDDSPDYSALLPRLCHSLLKDGLLSLAEFELLQIAVSRHLKEAGWRTRGSALPPALEGAATRLARHPCRQSGLQALAASACFSPWHFLRLFKERVGMTPHQFRLASQVSLGRRLLRDGASPAEAALAAGFSDQSHFHRHFKRLSGLTPGAFGRSGFSTKLG